MDLISIVTFVVGGLFGFYLRAILTPYLTKRAENLAVKKDTRALIILQQMGNKEFVFFDELLTKISDLQIASRILQPRKIGESLLEQANKEELFDNLRLNLESFDKFLNGNQGLYSIKTQEKCQIVISLVQERLDQYMDHLPENQFDPDYKKYWFNTFRTMQKLDTEILELRQLIIAHLKDPK